MCVLCTQFLLIIYTQAMLLYRYMTILGHVQCLCQQIGLKVTTTLFTMILEEEILVELEDTGEQVRTHTLTPQKIITHN